MRRDTAARSLANPAGQAPLRVFYDGACPRCAGLAARYSALDRDGRVLWLDLNAGEAELAAAGIAPEAALARLHAVDSDGRVSSGAAALAEVWDCLPRRRWLARLVRLPMFRPLIERAYDFVARRRVRGSAGGP